jgi:hypothetical protein
MTRSSAGFVSLFNSAIGKTELPTPNDPTPNVEAGLQTRLDLLWRFESRWLGVNSYLKEQSST